MTARPDCAAQSADAVREPTPQWSRRTWRLSVSATILLVALAVYLSELAGSQFYSDDYLYLQLASNADVTVQWFTVNNYGHFAPITRLAYLLIERFWGLDYALAALLPAALSAAVVAAVLAIGRLLLGRRLDAFAIGIVTAQSFLVVNVAMWWGAAVHVVGAAAAYLWCIAGFIGYCRTRRPHYQLLAVGMFSVALLIQERPLIVIGYLVLIRYLFYCGLPWGSSLGRAMRRDAWLWTPYVVVIVVYLWYRLTVFESAPTPGDPTDALTFTVSGFGRAFLPAVAGLRTDEQSGLITLSTVVGALLLMLVVALLGQVRRSVWRVVLFIGATYLANMALMVLGRQVADPVFQSRDLQYYLDPFLVLPVAVALGLGCLPVRIRLRSRTERRTRVVALTFVAAAVSFANLVSWITLVGANNQSDAHDYMNTAIDDLRQRPAEFDLMRFTMPSTVVPEFIAPWNDQPAVMALDPDVAGRLNPLSDTKVALLGDGRSAEVHPVSQASVELGEDNTEVISGGATTTNAVGMCISGPPNSVVDIQLGVGVEAGGLFYGLRYTSATDTNVLVATGTSEGFVYNWHQTLLPAGTGAAVFDRVEGTAATSIALIFLGGVDRLCVSGLWLGTTAVRDGDVCTGLDHAAEPTETAARCEEQWGTVLP